MTLTVPRRMNREVTAEHTGLLRMGLAEPESREYWRHADRNLAFNEKIQAAFEERWFGSRTMVRVRHLLLGFQARFDAFPHALKALHHWNPTEPADRRLLCHWHVQLSDPLYRTFTATHLVERLQHPQPTLDKNAVIRWLDNHTEQRWAASTTQRMTAGLMGCLNEVGFTEKTTALRPLSLPKVSDHALAYGLYLLRETEFVGQLADNPYLASVGLTGEQLEARLSRLPGVKFRKMSDVKELEWTYPDLYQWARREL